MVYYGEYHNLLWFTIVNTMVYYSVYHIYYGEYHNLLWCTIVNTMLYYGVLQ